MLYKQLGSESYAIRLEDNDDIMQSLKRFVQTKKVRAAQIEGIGSLKKVKLGYFDFEKTRQYTWQAFEEDMEILNLSGNVSTKESSYLPHIHVTLGRRDFTVLGGHLDDGSLANMVELIVKRLPGRLEKFQDAKTGLNILRLPRKL